MLRFGAGILVGIALFWVYYHFSFVKIIRGWDKDWRARALSAEQEVENWKVWAKLKGLDRGY